MCADYSGAENKYNQSILFLAIPWGVFTVWNQLTAHEGLKVVTDEDMITKCLLQRNVTHLSISGNSPFVRDKFAEVIGRDGESDEVEKLLYGTFTYE